MTGERFEIWFEANLLKNVETGSPIIMDRANFHRKKQLEQLCEKAKVNLFAVGSNTHRH
jgi:transposase